MRAVLAMDTRGGIGRQGVLPWHNSEDLKRFRTLTEASTMVMGSKTFFSLPINKRPLPGKGRKSIVLTFDPNHSKFDPYRTFENLSIMDADVFDQCPERGAAIVIGGAEIFRKFQPDIRTLHLSVFRGDYQCDTFVRVDFSEWTVLHQEEHRDHTYYVLEKN